MCTHEHEPGQTRAAQANRTHQDTPWQTRAGGKSDMPGMVDHVRTRGF